MDYIYIISSIVFFVAGYIIGVKYPIEEDEQDDEPSDEELKE